MQALAPKASRDERGLRRGSYSYLGTISRSVCVPVMTSIVDQLWLQSPQYARLMGIAADFEIGKNVYIDAVRMGDPGMVKIGDDVVLDRGASILSHATSTSTSGSEYLNLTFGKVEVRDKANIGPRAVLSKDTCVKVGQDIGAGSLHWSA